MHLEVLVEDASGSLLVGSALRKILGPSGDPHTVRVHSYKGVGHLPKGLKPGSEPDKRILLDQLPRLLRGYGRSLRGQAAAVLIVVDLDRENCKKLKSAIVNVVKSCHPQPNVLIRLAIEETEAWLLGDLDAIRAAYPKVKLKVFEHYVQDTVCGTWELLAEAIFPGGAKALTARGWPFIGQAKCEWAERIGPALEIGSNRSRSFQVFREGVRRLVSST